MRPALAALIILSCATSVSAQDITLSTPIDCDLTATCHIQQYVDRDPGTGARDYHCSTLSYDTHKGTDFALPSTKMLAQGVAVLAAADGVVRGTRDGMPDTGITPDTEDQIAGRECGNGVRIEHENGWVTQYCHLKRGSIAVREGDRVAAGTVLGDVGQSGRAAFPHLHLSVRKDGEVTDPFDPDGTLSCNTPGDSSLWADTPDYRAGGLIAVGFSDEIPTFDAIKAGTAHHDTLAPSAPALVIWGYSFGTRGGDILRLTLAGPDGVLLTQDVEMPRVQAQAFRAIGKKRRNTLWPSGTYTGTVTFIRNGTSLETRETHITLR